MWIAINSLIIPLIAATAISRSHFQAYVSVFHFGNWSSLLIPQVSGPCSVDNIRVSFWKYFVQDSFRETGVVRGLAQ